MPALKDQLQSDLTTAIKARDELSSATIRMALTAITNEEVAGKEVRTLSDDDVLTVLGREAIGVTRSGRRIAAAASTRDAYPNSNLGAALRQSAALIRANLGVRAIAVDSGGWDHHVNLTSVLPGVLGDLASSVAAFFTDLGDLADRVTLVTVSEFGRRLAQNGAHGLDHGYGNAVLVLGGGVKGGYYGRWPGLSAGKQEIGRASCRERV